MECIVHYDNQTNHSVLKKLSDTNIEKRLQLGGAHRHNQCDQVPSVLNPETHRVHLEPCYKR